MKAFRTAQVFGLAVKIFKVSGLLPQLMGYYNPINKTIAIDDSLVGLELEDTLLHELFHATLVRLYCQQELDDKFAEVIVEGLTRAVFENYEVKWKGLPKRRGKA